jgi:hypothetical protein
MARPPLPVDTYGDIRTEQLGPNRFRARARFRDYDGTIREVKATGTTGPAAVLAMKANLRDRVAPNDDEITRETHVSTLADLWLDEITTAEQVTPQTISRYEISVRVSIKPALGKLRIREAGAGRLDKCLREIAKDRPSAAKSAKIVLGLMFGLAVRRGALTTNPVRATGRLRNPRRKVMALKTERRCRGPRPRPRSWTRRGCGPAPAERPGWRPGSCRSGCPWAWPAPASAKSSHCAGKTSTSPPNTQP